MKKIAVLLISLPTREKNAHHLTYFSRFGAKCLEPSVMGTSTLVMGFDIEKHKNEFDIEKHQ